MIAEHHDKLISAIFITFSGNCKQALSFYQTCFGGLLQFETFGNKLDGYKELPVISGSLVSEKLIIQGSDLVHNEGRQVGNYIAIYLKCNNIYDRRALIRKLENGQKNQSAGNDDDQRLIEVIDIFDVRWILGIESS